MIVASWINFTDKLKNNKIEILVDFIIIAFFISITIILKENYTNKTTLKIIPFIYAFIFMITVNGAINLYEEDFKIRRIFALNLLQIIKFLFGFFIWSLFISFSFFIIKKNNDFIYNLTAILYLTFIAVKFITMFFYICDKKREYNPIKAMVRSFIDSNGKNIKILIFLIFNIIAIYPVYILKNILIDILILEIENKKSFFILKSITEGITDSFILIFISIHLSYLYKTISYKKNLVSCKTTKTKE